MIYQNWNGKYKELKVISKFFKLNSEFHLFDE